jgi:hypothetical protein
MQYEERALEKNIYNFFEVSYFLAQQEEQPSLIQTDRLS